MSGQPLLLIAYLVLFVFASLVQGARGPAMLVAIVVVQALCCEVVRRAWLAVSDQETREISALRQGGPPLLSLLFLFFVYYALAVALLFAFVVPGLWWAVSSSLAVVFVCVEDTGAVEGIKRSQSMIKRSFWPSLSYLAKLWSLIVLPAILVFILLAWGAAILHQEVLDWPILLAADVALSLLQGVFVMIAQLLTVGCLVTLYAHLKSQPALAQG